MKWLHVVAPEGISLHTRQWDVGYRVFGENNNVKYLFCNLGNESKEVVVSKVELPFGVRYYISLPFQGVATNGQTSLVDERSIYVAVKSLNLLSSEAFSLAQILRDVGDF